MDSSVKTFSEEQRILTELEENYKRHLSPQQREQNEKTHKKIRERYENLLNQLAKLEPSERIQKEYQIYEKLDRISYLIDPENPLEFQQSLMWMTQQGTERDFRLLLKLQKYPPFCSENISYFFKKALERCKPLYDSFKDLQKHHNELLKEYHNADEENISAELQSKIEDFVYQIENCGLYLYEDHERFAAQSLLNYWITRLYRLGYDELDLTLADYDRSLAPELKDEDYPYMGLKPFTENDREKFYGRDRLINELIFHLKQHSFISVVGSPKTGKSSLVFAGLVPQLKAGAIEGSDRWYYYPAIEPGDRPLENLAKILKPDATEDWLQQQVTAFKNNPEHLSQLVRELHPDRSVFLVVDRFEELFNLCFDIEERQAFIDNLVNYLESRNPQNFLILTIQSNFIWKIEQFQDETFNKLLKTSQIKITALEDSEVKEAIEHPAESVGLVFDLGLVDALIKDFSGDIDALPLLQFSLLKLWEYREQNRVTWDSYQKLGRGGGGLAFSNSAEQFYKSLSEIEKSLCRSILLRLVRPLQGFQPRNRQVKRQAIQKLATDDLSISDLEKMLEKLVDENLIYKIPGQREDDDRFEIAHESLIRYWKDLRDWLDEERGNMLQRLRLTDRAEEWQENGKDKSFLLPASVLAAYRSFKDLSLLEQEFIRCSLQESKERLA